VPVVSGALVLAAEAVLLPAFADAFLAEPREALLAAASVVAAFAVAEA
jgi:hypothetical protein